MGAYMKTIPNDLEGGVLGEEVIHHKCGCRLVSEKIGNAKRWVLVKPCKEHTKK